MHTLVIHGSSGRLQRYILTEGTHLVGRGEDADLSLPNVSVSREHARIHVTSAGVEVEDLGSRNGLRVAGDKVPENGRVPFALGAEVRVGKFRLTLLDPAERFFQGRSVQYIPEFSASAPATQAATHAMSAADALKFEEDSLRIQESKVVSAANKRRFWHPEDRPLTFGGKGMVAVDGLFAGKIVAEIVWRDRRHVLVKKAGFLVPVKVGGAAVTEHVLSNGDVLQIGNSSFVFEAPTFG